MSPLLMALSMFALWLLSGVRIAQEYERGLVFRLGRFRGERGPGLFWIIPLLEWSRIIDIRTVTVNVEPQETITKDSVTIKVNAVVWYKVTDPGKAVIRVADYRAAVYQVALTTLRNVIGQHMLDEVLRERDKINEMVWQIVEEATSPWGVQVEMVEMKDVEIPPNMQRAMAKEAEAMREKRARLIKAEAEFEASVKLGEASLQVMKTPAALELRRMQMLTEIGAEQNTTTIVMMPSDFVVLARNLAEGLGDQVRMTATPSETEESVSVES